MKSPKQTHPGGTRETEAKQEKSDVLETKGGDR